MFKKLTVTEFLNELSSNSPAPGGGSVAALSSSLSASLGSMVANLTIGKKSYNELQEEEKLKVQDALKKCVEFRERYLDLMDEDADSFMEVMEAFKLPKETEDEKLKRGEAIQKGYKTALSVPRKLCVETLDIYGTLEILAQYGNKNAISDVGVAVILAHAAVESALLNVMINLGPIKDENFVEETNTFIKETREKSLQWKEKINNIVIRKL